MIGLLVITHSRLAEEYLQAAEMIVGPFPKAEAISIDRSFPVDDARSVLSEVLGRVGDGGDGVLIMTDMFGGTPTNISADFLSAGEVEILTGVNLPMVLKFISARQSQSLDDLTAMLKQYGQQSIIRPADLLNRSLEGKTAS